MFNAEVFPKIFEVLNLDKDSVYHLTTMLAGVLDLMAFSALKKRIAFAIDYGFYLLLCSRP